MDTTIKKLRLLGLILILLAATVFRCAAESNAWDGTWKLNKTKSRLSGPTFVIAVLGKGEFQLITKSYSYKLICDGKYRPVVGNRSAACLKATSTTMDVAEKDSGKSLNTVHREVSPDGRR